MGIQDSITDLVTDFICGEIWKRTIHMSEPNATVCKERELFRRSKPGVQLDLTTSVNAGLTGKFSYNAGFDPF